MPRMWCRGVAYGDYDDDGDLDIVMNNSEQPAVLMRNDGGNSSNWLQIELQGTVSNRDAAGAVVYVESDGWTRMQQVKLGSGYQSSSQKNLFFGIGAEGLGRQDSRRVALWNSAGREGDKSQPKDIACRK